MVAPLVGAWIEMIMTPEHLTQKLSLPSWERGLKSHCRITSVCNGLSLPSWERGLKSVHGCDYPHGQVSLPSWERGLKSMWKMLEDTGYRRSPRGSVD